MKEPGFSFPSFMIGFWIAAFGAMGIGYFVERGLVELHREEWACTHMDEHPDMTQLAQMACTRWERRPAATP